MRQSPKKQAILDQAEELFYQHGFHAIGVKSILDKAGVAPMTMYYHFKSKEEVIKEILMRREVKYFQHLEEGVNKKDLKAYLKSLLNTHISWLTIDGFNGCLFLRAKQEYDGINDEITELSTRHKQTLLKKVEEDLKIFDAPNSLSLQLLIILEGLTSMVQISDIEEVKRSAKDLLNSITISK
ncbi:TetR/AcrR family transcriptional regulator [Gracilibacillus caseinilyticus]|uniref:TetR/AcrR family transcriptional regulator n=1 Tax=Gracilibacillus caseinilyticus TaxID=2932256 RepID=A0ABY4EY78_9BACI|nr:TetR/AcrR family transcriptional regulator [Gracilibacillus caseinilyticus]UOQ49356.1 TetR/AcrR family transcriptional regulator [Gracilibacillus caseinilyticus]